MERWWLWRKKERERERRGTHRGRRKGDVDRKLNRFISIFFWEGVEIERWGENVSVTTVGFERKRERRVYPIQKQRGIGWRIAAIPLAYSPKKGPCTRDQLPVGDLRSWGELRLGWVLTGRVFLLDPIGTCSVKMSKDFNITVLSLYSARPLKSKQLFIWFMRCTEWKMLC